ncbi:MAG: CopD family protein [Wenzhouxiangella sp.]
MNAYVAVKLIHISAIVIWSAGLLYLPGLFAEHVGTTDDDAFRRLRSKTRLVFVGLASPAAVIAIASGTILVFLAASLGGWMVLKLFAVSAMVFLHIYFGHLMGLLYRAPGFRRPFAHLLLLVPVIFIATTVIYLVTGKPL